MRRNASSRIGYALVAFTLVVWLASAGLGLNPGPFAIYAAIAMGAGLLLIAAGRLRPGAPKKNRNDSVLCPQCGWQGAAATWDEYEGCPECDNQQGKRTWIQ